MWRWLHCVLYEGDAAAPSAGCLVERNLKAGCVLSEQHSFAVIFPCLAASQSTHHASKGSDTWWTPSCLFRGKWEGETAEKYWEMVHPSTILTDFDLLLTNSWWRGQTETFLALWCTSWGILTWKLSTFTENRAVGNYWMQHSHSTVHSYKKSTNEPFLKAKMYTQKHE